ncbi:MAG: TA system VapC family ribonuclease toxin [Acidobacteriota bacterium]
MLSIDANLLLYAFNAASPWHRSAAAFLSDLHSRDDVLISELVLVEFYTLLRNPQVVERPLPSSEAVKVISTYRRHPRWRLEGFAPDSLGLHEALWASARGTRFARRRIYDARLALTLIQQGVTEFATANVKDFEGFRLSRVWNPL